MTIILSGVAAALIIRVPRVEQGIRGRSGRDGPTGPPGNAVVMPAARMSANPKDAKIGDTVLLPAEGGLALGLQQNSWFVEGRE
jgi:hypothetical protein